MPEEEEGKQLCYFLIKLVTDGKTQAKYLICTVKVQHLLSMYFKNTDKIPLIQIIMLKNE